MGRRSAPLKGMPLELPLRQVKLRLAREVLKAGDQVGDNGGGGRARADLVKAAAGQCDQS